MAQNTATATPAARSRLRVQARILLGEEIALGPGKADLLDAIRACGSISAAGKQMDMSYRRAWLLVDSMNRCFEEPLVATAKGGRRGGGAHLTRCGKDVLTRYRAMQAAIENAAVKHFKGLQPLLRPEPLAAAQHTHRSGGR